MRLFLVVCFSMFALTCHGALAQPTTPLTVVADDSPNRDYRFILPLIMNGKVHSLNYRIPGNLDVASDGIDVNEDYSSATYEDKRGDNLLRVEAFTSAKTPEQALMNVINKVREVERFAFGQVMTTADGSESYAVFVSIEYGVAGIVLFRTVPDVEGALLGINLIRTYARNKTAVGDIAMVTAITRSLRIDP